MRQPCQMGDEMGKTKISKQEKQYGKLIVFEGPDGVGKTTIAQKIAQCLNDSDEKCKLMAFPGKEPGTLGDLVYKLHHDPSKYNVEDFTSASKQVLHIAAHLDAIERVILPTLSSGCHVILDRFWWSTWVYGVVSNINRNVLEKIIDIEREFWGDLKPTITILLRRPAPINRKVSLQYWRSLSYEYDALSEKEKLYYPVTTLTNDLELEVITRKIQEYIVDAMNGSDIVSGHVASSEQEQLDLNFGQDEIVNSSSPTVISHILPAKPTVVFDTYWRFATERQDIFFRKLKGQKAPWTDDPILSTFKFTNAYRASDRVSQYLIRHVIYRQDLPTTIEEVFFRIILFKLFYLCNSNSLRLKPLPYLR
ncbi:thymidylate kinase [Leptolyngbya sp. PCC 7375]|nr:thymidylate kinase [Leptolyngbya sp. PCC 7375]